MFRGRTQYSMRGIFMDSDGKMIGGKLWMVVALLLAIGVHGLDGNNKARYDNYRLYRLHLTTAEHVQIFQEIEERSDSYSFIGHAREVGQRLIVLVAAHKIAECADVLERYKVEHEILTTNFQAQIDAQESTIKPANSTAQDMDWDHYFHLQTIHAWLEDLAVRYKNIVTVIDVGNSYEGLPLKGIKLSHKSNNTAVFIEGGIHAREWISPATTTFILSQLLTSNDTQVQDIARNFDWFFFPVINPDGYVNTFEEDRMWRKTRQPVGICRGTDLNRNWNAHWNESGASPDPCRYDYAGTKAFSEPEAKLISDFLTSNVRTARIQTYLSFHSYSQLLMFPYGASSAKAPNYNHLKSIGEKAIAALSHRYNTSYKTGSVYETIYPSSGSSHDWAYSALNIPITYTFELRGLPNSTEMFILPANQITPTGWETLDAVVAILTEARKLGYYDPSKPWSPSSAIVHKGTGALSALVALIFTVLISHLLQ